MRRFYAPKVDFSDSNVVLDMDETRHLRDVLRLRLRDEVSVFDGTGHEFRCVIREISKKASELSVIEEITPASPESPFEITLAAAILKNERFDLVIQKAVELGVAAIIPLQTFRSEIKLKETLKRMERWRRIALEATKQSGRARLMQILEPLDFNAFIANAKNKLVMFSERDGGSISMLGPGKKITAVVGPVGGWEDSELETARSNGVNIVTLGGRILRAETASISIATILQHRFGDLN